MGESQCGPEQKHRSDPPYIRFPDQLSPRIGNAFDAQSGAGRSGRRLGCTDGPCELPGDQRRGVLKWALPGSGYTEVTSDLYYANGSLGNPENSGHRPERQGL